MQNIWNWADKVAFYKYLYPQCQIVYILIEGALKEFIKSQNFALKLCPQLNIQCKTQRILWSKSLFKIFFLPKSKIIPQYYPNSFLLSNMKLVFCFELFSKVGKKEKAFITRNVCHGLQLSAQANVTPCNLRERKFWPFSAKMLACCHLPLDLN